MIIDESQLPVEFRPVLRRLSRAGESEEMRQRMTIEDEYLDDLRRRERRTQRLEEERDKAQAEKKSETKARKKAEADKQKAEADKLKAEAQARREKFIAAESMRVDGMSDTLVQRYTGIDAAQLEAWIQSGRP